MDLVYQPHIIKEVRTLTEQGMSATEIAAAMGISRHTVMRVQKLNEITPSRLPNGAPPRPAAPRAELVAAARPWAQAPWSAKDVPDVRKAVA